MMPVPYGSECILTAIRITMAYTQPRGKSLMVQRQFTKLGIPRMYRSSGTNDEETFARINAMLSKLADLAKVESSVKQVLTDLNTGQRTFLDALALVEADGWNAVRKLVPAAHEGSNRGISSKHFEEWISGHDVQPSTRRNYRHNYNAAMAFAKGRGTMDALPAILADYKKQCVKLGKNKRAFNLALVVMQAWVKSTIGDESKTYRELRKVKRIKIPKYHRKNAYFSPTDIMNIMARLPDYVAAAVWTQTTHGMNWKEHAEDGCWVEGNGLFINGQKNEHRRRTVPLIKPPAAAISNYNVFEQWLAAASDANGQRCTSHDLRRCYSRWLGEVGIPHHKVQMYMGQRPQDQTSEYQYHTTQDFLKDDADKIRGWLTAQLEANPPVADAAKVRRNQKRKPPERLERTRVVPRERKKPPAVGVDDAA